MIYLEGYRSTKQSILFRPGAGYKINATLEKLGEGERSEPRPSPPANATHRTRRRSRRTLAGRDPIARSRRAAAPGEASGFGTLAVRVQPAGAVVLVDGERWEGPETTSERLIVQLAEGRHRVEVRKDGYQPYSTDVEVRSGQTATLNVSLPQERR